MSKSQPPEGISKDLVESTPILANPWDNVYWFARMLIASDKYGGVGSDAETMLGVSSTIRTTIDKLREQPEDEIVKVASDAVFTLLINRWKNAVKKVQLVKNLCKDLKDKLLTIQDIEVLGLTCERVLVPITRALEVIPSDDRIFAESIASALLKEKKEEGLAIVINVWDDIGSQGCLTAERMEVVRLFGELRKYLEPRVTKEEMDIILSAFCQEFERRLGQKRKGRGGRAVESAASLVLKHFGFKTTHAPEHFTTGLEIDRWVRCKDGWLIGISCKRTFRERWKQAYTTDLDLLRRHKIKGLWHLLTFDRDLSDDKITEIGSHKAILYLPDKSERYCEVATHAGMKDYVRPLSGFVNDLQKEVGS